MREIVSFIWGLYGQVRRSEEADMSAFRNDRPFEPAREARAGVNHAATSRRNISFRDSDLRLRNGACRQENQLLLGRGFTIRLDAAPL
jgi:hypothetical protein